MQHESTHASAAARPGTTVSAQQSARTEKFTTRTSLLVDAVLVAAFFAYMFSVVSPHVQSENPWFIALWGGGAAACLSTVFWLAIQMFRVVLRAQLASRK